MGYPQKPGAPRPGASIWFIILGTCGGCACLGVIAIVSAFYFAARAANQAFVAVHASVRQMKVDLRAANYKMVSDHGHRFIVGTCRNTSSAHAYEFVTVDFDGLDTAGHYLNAIRDEDTQKADVQGIRARMNTELEKASNEQK
jgi:hypothetical protein